MRPGSNTSIFLSLVVCFVALVHVEVELHAHRQMLQVLSQQRADNFEPRKTVRNEPTTASFHSDSVEGKLLPWSQRFFLIFLRERGQQQAAKRRQQVA